MEPIVWPLVGGEQPGIRTFAGHANTVLDIVGRIGAPPSLVIYTEGNHLMVLLSKDIAEEFPVSIAFGRVIRPLRPEAAKAFEEFFFSRARDVYPRYDFARMSDGEYGAPLALD